jgi:hypothetical protein
MDIPGIRLVPNHFERFRRLVLQARKLAIANFADIFAEVYEERPILSWQCRTEVRTFSASFALVL